MARWLPPCIRARIGGSVGSGVHSESGDHGGAHRASSTPVRWGSAGHPGIRCAGAVHRAPRFTRRRCRALISTAPVRRAMRTEWSPLPPAPPGVHTEGDGASDVVHSMHPLVQVCRHGLHPVLPVENTPCPATSFPRSFDVSPWHRPLPMARRPEPDIRWAVAEGRFLPPGAPRIITVRKGDAWCGRCRALWHRDAFHRVGVDATGRTGLRVEPIVMRIGCAVESTRCAPPGGGVRCIVHNSMHRAPTGAPPRAAVSGGRCAWRATAARSWRGGASPSSTRPKREPLGRTTSTSCRWPGR